VEQHAVQDIDYERQLIGDGRPARHRIASHRAQRIGLLLGHRHFATSDSPGTQVNGKRSSVIARNMSFLFPSWGTSFSPAFHEDAKAMLEGALNKVSYGDMGCKHSSKDEL
jgi:hypothetical protein